MLRKLPISLMIALLPWFAFGQYTLIENTTMFKQELKSKTEAINSMNSDFVQEKHISFMSKPIITEGSFKFKTPNKLKWAYTNPFNYSMIFKNDQLYIDDEGNRNKIDLSSNEMFKELNAIILNSLVGNIEALISSGQFDLNLYKKDKNYKLILHPKKEAFAEYMKDIEIFFDQKNLLVSKVIMNEDSGDYTVISFNNKKINDAIADSVFDF